MTGGLLLALGAIASVAGGVAFRYRDLKCE
jgi:hypothetical protein